MNIFERQRAQLREVLENEIARGKAFLEENKKRPEVIETASGLQYEVLVEGNTDNVPIAQTNIRNNWDLSALRASSVVQVLQTKYAVDPKRLTAGGRGEFNPIADNSTPAGKSKNRRIEIILTPKLDEISKMLNDL